MTAHGFVASEVIALLAAIALACSSSSAGKQSASEQPAQPEQPSLGVACAVSSAAPGDRPVACSATLRGASADIAWTLRGPGTLSAATGGSTEYLPPSDLAAAAVAHVTATAAGLSANVDIALTPSPPAGMTLVGRVIDAGGSPLAGVGVVLPGLPGVTTGDDGAFRITGVEPPYDLVLFTEGPGATVEQYVGLSRTDPVLVLYASEATAMDAAERTATVAGQLRGGDPAARANGDYQGVLFTSTAIPPTDPPFAWGGKVGWPPSSYGWTLGWLGPETLDASVLAVQWRADRATGAPIAYWMGTSTVTLTDAVAAKLPPIELGAVPVVTTRGSASLPAGYVLQRVSVHVAPAPGAPVFPLFYDEQPQWREGPGFTYVLPAMDGGAVRVCGRAADTGANHLEDVSLACVDATAKASVELPMPAAPRPLAPANGANAVGADTTFAWVALPGGVHVLEVTPAAADAPRFVVVTADSRAVLPSLGRPELDLVPGAAYSWRVRGFSPVADVDAFAAPGAGPLALDYPAPAGALGSWARTTPWRFVAR